MLEYEHREGNTYYRCVYDGRYYALAIHIDTELELYENEFDMVPTKIKKVYSGVLRAQPTLTNGSDRTGRHAM
jgi:hypothetical protein